jgi:nuclear transport factor 2 (NTF2) superfamily protein
MAFGKFDKSLDKELFSETISFETTRITVGVFSYNDGEKKMQIARENMSQNGEWSFAKLGRMFKDEAEKVIPVMEKALKHM